MIRGPRAGGAVAALRAEAAALSRADRWCVCAGAALAAAWWAACAGPGAGFAVLPGFGAVLTTALPTALPTALTAELAAGCAAAAAVLLGGWSAWLARVDLRQRRLPNPVLGWATCTVGITLGAALLFAGEIVRLGIALGVTALTAAGGLLLWLGLRGRMGAGDLKLVPLTVIPVAVHDPVLLGAVYVGTLLLGCALAGALTILRGRREFAAGPILLLACWVSLIAGAAAR